MNCILELLKKQEEAVSYSADPQGTEREKLIQLACPYSLPSVLFYIGGINK